MIWQASRMENIESYEDQILKATYKTTISVGSWKGVVSEEEEKWGMKDGVLHGEQVPI